MCFNAMQIPLPLDSNKPLTSYLFNEKFINIKILVLNTDMPALPTPGGDSCLGSFSLSPARF